VIEYGAPLGGCAGLKAGNPAASWLGATATDQADSARRARIPATGEQRSRPFLGAIRVAGARTAATP